MNTKKALVLGASGLVGRHLVNQLLVHPHYESVTCLVRKPLPHSQYADPFGRMNPVVVNFDQLQDYQGYFTVDHVFCCLGSTLKTAGSKAAFRKVDFEYVHIAAQLARAQRAMGFVWISSVGANAKSKHFYLRVKGELDNAIMRMPQLNFAAAVKPSLLLGKRSEGRLLENLGQSLAPLVSPFMKGPLSKYHPVHATDVARQMIELQIKQVD